MSTYNEFKEINKDCFSGHNPMCSKQEIEGIAEFTRLELYNRGLPCGPEAIRKRLDIFYLVQPLPSESTISRILVKRCLTHGRTGGYE